jgi:hypothetical protein
MTGAPAPEAVRRASYREPTVTGILETIDTDLWGADMAAQRSELHKVLFISLGGTLEEWAAGDQRDREADALFRAAGIQAQAVIEWLAGLQAEQRRQRKERP